MKKVNLRILVGSVLGSMLIAQAALASSIIGTNISTTGTLGVTAGLATFDGGVSVSTNFEVTGNKRVGINAGGSTDTTLEVGGTASISGAFTFGDGTATGAINTSDWDISATGVMTNISGITDDGANTFSGGLSTFSGGVSVSTNFEVTGDKRLGINAGGSTDTTLEVGGIASISSAVLTGSLISFSNLLVTSAIGVASASTIYSAEFGGTGTTSLLFGGTTNTGGTCLQMRATNGTWVYGRILASAPTVLTFSTTKCHQ